MLSRMVGRTGLCAALCAAAGAGCAGPDRAGALRQPPAPIVSSAHTPSATASPLASQPGDAAVASSSAARRAEVVMRALALLGVGYRFGGDSPQDGLDCSGLVRHVFHEALGLVLPRRTEQLSRAGEDVDPRRLKPGDLVFFNTLRRAFSHVGIYIGDNQFVHAPSRGGQVRVEALDRPYWLARFDGARRLVTQPPAQAQADAGD